MMKGIYRIEFRFDRTEIAETATAGYLHPMAVDFFAFHYTAAIAAVGYLFHGTLHR